MIYCFPKLSDCDLYFFRFLGPGLGNLLLPWARAKIYARSTGYSFIPPTWSQIKMGSLLRGEMDSRSYMGLFEPGPNESRGLSRAKKLFFSRKIPECKKDCARSGDVIIFSGMGKLFGDLIGHSNFIKTEILSMLVKNRIECLAAEWSCRERVAVHVRLGDFSVGSFSDLTSGMSNTRIPVEWYAAVVGEIREALGYQIEVNVFSDGSDQQLVKLLELGGVKRVSGNNAIEDLLLISEHRLLVASGSTFSMWGSFLGQIPTIWHPGQLKQRVLENHNLEIELHDYDDISSTFIQGALG